MSSAPAPATVRVTAGGDRDYEVVIGVGMLDRVGEAATSAAPNVRRWAVISDETVAGLYGARIRAAFEGRGPRPELLTFPAGEAHKTRNTWAALTDGLLAAGHGRDSGVVALGGGVSGDLAGFVAATFMRGVPVIQVPTSIVAMVDSAVGGKTGVDTPAGKNLVGAFHAPARVVIDAETATTLSRAQRAEGIAEAVKHGAIVDADYARVIAGRRDALLDGSVAAVQAMVLRSVEIKAAVVGRDERESGLREILNFGHTLGHALEAASDYGVSHGHAVAMGMVLEARLGERLGLTAPGTADELVGILRALELPVAPPAGLGAERVMPFLRADKKVREGRIRCVFLAGLGSVREAERGWSHAVDRDTVATAFSAA